MVRAVLPLLALLTGCSLSAGTLAPSRSPQAENRQRLERIALRTSERGTREALRRLAQGQHEQAALLALEAAVPEHIAPVPEGLAGLSQQQQVQIVQLLAASSDPRATEALVLSLSQVQAPARQAVLQGLEGREHPGIRQVLLPMLPRVGPEELALILGALGGPASEAELQAGLAAPPSPQAARFLAAAPEARDRLVSWLDSDDPQLVQAVGEALLDQGPAICADLRTRASGLERARGRAQAARVLVAACGSDEDLALVEDLLEGAGPQVADQVRADLGLAPMQRFPELSAQELAQRAGAELQQARDASGPGPRYLHAARAWRYGLRGRATTEILDTARGELGPPRVEVSLDAGPIDPLSEAPVLAALVQATGEALGVGAAVQQPADDAARFHLELDCTTQQTQDAWEEAISYTYEAQAPNPLWEERSAALEAAPAWLYTCHHYCTAEDQAAVACPESQADTWVAEAPEACSRWLTQVENPEWDVAATVLQETPEFVSLERTSEGTSSTQRTLDWTLCQGSLELSVDGLDLARIPLDLGGYREQWQTTDRAPRLTYEGEPGPEWVEVLPLQEQDHTQAMLLDGLSRAAYELVEAIAPELQDRWEQRGRALWATGQESLGLRLLLGARPELLDVRGEAFWEELGD